MAAVTCPSNGARSTDSCQGLCSLLSARNGDQFWLVKLLASITGNQELKSAGELMAYFDKVGEGNQAASINGMLRGADDDFR